jgi:hypothetical protein
MRETEMTQYTFQEESNVDARRMEDEDRNAFGLTPEDEAYLWSLLTDAEQQQFDSPAAFVVPEELPFK